MQSLARLPPFAFYHSGVQERREHNRDQRSYPCFVLITSIIAKERIAVPRVIHRNQFPRDAFNPSPNFSSKFLPLNILSKFLPCSSRRKKGDESFDRVDLSSRRTTQRSLEFLSFRREEKSGGRGGGKKRKSKVAQKSAKRQKMGDDCAGFRLHDSISRIKRESWRMRLFSFYLFFFFLFSSSFFLPFFFTAEIFPNIRSRSRNQSDYPRYVASTRVHQHTRLVAAIGRGSRAFFHCCAVV